MERKYSVKLTESQAELPFFTVLHHTSTPGYNQSQGTDLYTIIFMLNAKKKKKITLENKSRTPEWLKKPTYFLITWRQPTAPSSPHLLVNT